MFGLINLIILIFSLKIKMKQIIGAKYMFVTLISIEVEKISINLLEE